MKEISAFQCLMLNFVHLSATDRVQLQTLILFSFFIFGSYCSNESSTKLIIIDIVTFIVKFVCQLIYVLMATVSSFIFYCFNSEFSHCLHLGYHGRESPWLLFTMKGNIVALIHELPWTWYLILFKRFFFFAYLFMSCALVPFM